MSAIALFVRLPKTALDGLRKVAVPDKPLWGKLRDTYDDYLRQPGEEVVDYQWSGYVLWTLLPYLEKQHKINLMRSEYEILADFLVKARGVTHFVLTDEQRLKYADRLDAAKFSEEQLRYYYNEFNETVEPGIGKPMIEGIKAFQWALRSIDQSSVVVLSIS
jgi:hypothetical protein